MEKADEFKGAGNSYDFGARIYDLRLGRWLSLDPEARVYPSNSDYSFVANLPTILIDPTGRIIRIGNGETKKKKDMVVFEAGKPAPDHLNQFQKDSWAAVQASIDSNPEPLDLATNDDVELKVFKGPAGESPAYGSGEIYWDPTTGMFVPIMEDEDTYVIYPEDESALMSPNETFRHELKHAYNDLILGIWKKRDRKDPEDEAMDTLEEEKTILEVDIGNGIERHGHYGLPMINVSCPSCKDGTLPEVFIEQENGDFQTESGLTKVKVKDTKIPKYMGAPKKEKK